MNLANTCECGCVRIAKKGNKFIHGHNSAPGMLGKYHNLKTRRKMIISAKKRYENPEEREKMSESCKGKKHTEEAKRKMRVCNKGERNPNWQGGISSNPYPLEYRQIKDKIRERDNRACQLCSKIKQSGDNKLDVHHIDYNKRNSDPKNLITLCHSCNKEVESDKKAWTRIFKRKIKNIYKQMELMRKRK